MHTIKKADLVDIKLMSINFYIDDTDKAKKGGSVELESNTSLAKTDEENINILMSEVKVSGKSPQGEILFSIEAKYNSVHSIADDDTIKNATPEDASNYLFSMVYPTIRDDVMNILSRAGLRQIALPFNVLKK